MKKDAENLSHMVPIRSILAAKYDIPHLTKLISLVFQQAAPFSETENMRFFFVSVFSPVFL
jgi:hypothetical protein